jgi:hypothetical protein
MASIIQSSENSRLTSQPSSSFSHLCDILEKISVDDDDLFKDICQRLSEVVKTVEECRTVINLLHHLSNARCAVQIEHFAGRIRYLETIGSSFNDNFFPKPRRVRKPL